MIASKLAAVAALVASVSCTSDGGASSTSFSFAGTWDGVVALPGEAPSRMLVNLYQDGRTVTGYLGGLGVVRGRASGSGLSFVLELGGVCADSLTGSGSVEPLQDRDKLHLTWSGPSTCGSSPGTGTFDRLRCTGGASACSGGTGPADAPYCANLATDPVNCGGCGWRCRGELEVCVAGRCELPACAGPVPLAPARRFGLPADRLWALTLADADGDGDEDAIAAAVAGDAGAAVVARGDGRGGFGLSTTTFVWTSADGATVTTASAIATGDLNGDGRLDLALYAGAPTYPARGEGQLVTLLGNGDGSFRVSERFSTGSDEELLYLGPATVVLADLDGDGDDDLAARAGSRAAVEVRLANGDGTLGEAAAYPLPEDAGALAAGDADGDGILDLVVASQGFGPTLEHSPHVTVLPGDGDGTFGLAVVSPGVDAPRAAALLDADGDGTLDLAVASWWAYASHGVPNVALLRGTGDGTFLAPVALESDEWSFTSTIAAADVDADGDADVVVGNGMRFDLVLGRGDGTFAPPFEHPLPSAGLVAAGDLDGDGATELVVAPIGGDGVLNVLRACGP